MRYPEDIEKKLIIKRLCEAGILKEMTEPGTEPPPMPESAVKIPPAYLSEDETPVPVIRKLLSEAVSGGSESEKGETEVCIESCEEKDEKSAEVKYEVAGIFRVYGEDYRANNSLSVQQLQVMYSIENCRTGRFGYHIDMCDMCGHTELSHNSCRNRHCPKCQGSRRIQWVNARMDDLLPVPYYHVVFTLPDEIYPVCMFSQKLIYDLLFSCSAETLKQFGEDPKHLGAKIGFFGVLHTWGQTMIVHPHIHYAVPGGGISEDGRWVWPEHRDKFLFPVKALSAVFRGKFIEGLKKAYRKGDLEFPGELEKYESEENFEKWLDRLVKNEWVVYSKAPFGGPGDVVRYVGRYSHRVAISNSRIISIDNGIIKFRYKNYKKKDEAEEYEDLWEDTELPADEFIRRFLCHVVPPGYHRIRHYGFLGNGQKAKRQEIWEELVFEEDCGLPEYNTGEDYDGVTCPECETGKMIPVLVTDRFGRTVKGSYELLSERTGKWEEFRKRQEEWEEPEEWAEVCDTS